MPHINIHIVRGPIAATNVNVTKRMREKTTRRRAMRHCAAVGACARRHPAVRGIHAQVEFRSLAFHIYILFVFICTTDCFSMCGAHSVSPTQSRPFAGWLQHRTQLHDGRLPGTRLSCLHALLYLYVTEDRIYTHRI